MRVILYICAFFSLFILQTHARGGGGKGVKGVGVKGGKGGGPDIIPDAATDGGPDPEPTTLLGKVGDAIGDLIDDL